MFSPELIDRRVRRPNCLITCSRENAATDDRTAPFNGKGKPTCGLNFTGGAEGRRGGDHKLHEDVSCLQPSSSLTSFCAASLLTKYLVNHGVNFDESCRMTSLDENLQND